MTFAFSFAIELATRTNSPGLSGSSTETEKKVETLDLDEAEKKEYLGVIAAVYEEFLNMAVDSVEEKYGSMQDYLKNQLGLSDTDLKTLRDKFLE